MHAITAFDAGPLIFIDSAELGNSPGAGLVLYFARSPAFMKSQSTIKNAPTSRVGRRPQRSIKRRAGTVITTLMTYCIEDESNSVFEPMPALYMLLVTACS